MKPLISQAMVALAAALQITLSLFAAWIGAWLFVAMYVFTAIVLLGAYFRPMAFDVQDAARRVKR